jgi:hypothetical protein
VSTQVRVFVVVVCIHNAHARTVNKQLNDKERVAAALENPALVDVLETCLESVGHR